MWPGVKGRLLAFLVLAPMVVFTLLVLGSFVGVPLIGLYVLAAAGLAGSAYAVSRLGRTAPDTNTKEASGE